LESFDPENGLGFLEYSYGLRKFLYFGQIKENKPCGLGIQIDEESTVQEGMFFDEDSIQQPYININSN